MSIKQQLLYCLLGVLTPAIIGVGNDNFHLEIISLINILTFKLSPISAFYLPFSRFWELMVGGALAYIKINYLHLI